MTHRRDVSSAAIRRIWDLGWFSTPERFFKNDLEATTFQSLTFQTSMNSVSIFLKWSPFFQVQNFWTRRQQELAYWQHKGCWFDPWPIVLEKVTPPPIAKSYCCRKPHYLASPNEHQAPVSWSLSTLRGSEVNSPFSNKALYWIATGLLFWTPSNTVVGGEAGRAEETHSTANGSKLSERTLFPAPCEQQSSFPFCEV